MAFGFVLVAAGNDQRCEPPEGRIGAILARFDLLRIKRFAVAGNQRAHHRMLRLMRLQEAVAAPLFAPGAARDLMQQLECALGRARIAIGETEIGIDNADEIELREMMALGDELRADDDVELSLGDLVELGAQPLDRFHEIARQDDAALAGKQRRALLPPAARRPGPTAASVSVLAHCGHASGTGMPKPQ